MKKSILFGAMAAALLFAASPSHALFGGADHDYSKFCEVKTPRQTVILVDDRLMIEGQQRWAESMMKLVESSLMPSEPVTVVQLKPETGSSSRLWTGCFPDYPESEKAKMDGGLFGKNPLKVLETQQAAFRRDFGAALGAILQQNQRTPVNVNLDQANLPGKQLARALKDATSHFDRTRGHIRAVVYSDMVENSDLGSPLADAAAKGESAARTIGLNLQQAVLYIYGVGSTVPGVPSETLRNFWSPLLSTGVGHIAGFGSDLTLQATPPVAVARYDLTIAVGKETRTGMMHVLADRDGRLVDTVAVSGAVQRALVSEGFFTCDVDSTCKLEAKFPTSLVTRMSGAGELGVTEQIRLSGPRERMTGRIGISDAYLKDGTAAEFDVVARAAE